jgi:membrane associated rhomboid family serine protease
VRYAYVTLLLMAVSILVAGVSNFGKDCSRVDALFFASQQEFEQLMFTEEEIEASDVISEEEIMQRLRMIEQMKKNPERDIARGQVWRAFTPMFLHFGMLHVVFNMMWLWQFGLLIETRFRSLPFLALVLFTALLSNGAQAFVSGPNFGGMSGVNYGLFGFLLARSKLHPNPGFVINPQTAAMLLIWLVVCFTGMMGPVANTAHLVGFASGGLVGIVNALMGGAWANIQRKQQFRSALRKSADSLHHCKICQRTEHDDPDLEFYVHMTDAEEYCKDHLPD